MVETAALPPELVAGRNPAFPKPDTVSRRSTGRLHRE
jgi:hypothetical protein